MLSIDGFPPEIRTLNKEALEDLVLSIAPPNRERGVLAALWLAKTRELGGGGSRLGETRTEAIRRIGNVLSFDELLDLASYLGA